jgi:hypothetical protein
MIINNININEILNRELKDIISFVKEFKEDKILSHYINFNWKYIVNDNLYTKSSETILQINLEAFTPIQMNFILNDNITEKEIISFTKRYKNLIFMQTIFKR